MGFLSDMFKGSGGSLVGGTLGSITGLINQSSANNHAMAVAQMNAALQKEFAQNSIKWRVEDAKRAGVHPMAALGISPASFSPVSAPFTSNGLEDMLATMGQNVDRAALAAKDAKAQEDAKDHNDKVNSLQLENLGLQNDLLRADIESKHARLRQAGVSPAPSTDIKLPFGDQPNAPFKSSSSDRSILGKNVYRLFVPAMHGDTFNLVLNPDIADSISESFINNTLASIVREVETGTNHELIDEIISHFPKYVQRKIADGEMRLVSVLGSGAFRVVPVQPGESFNRYDVFRVDDFKKFMSR